ncbi:unnamed protein product [Lymnaea stagnalis]|uniref:Glutamate-rich protein 2 n=1 Tax=Lymnaea stagnalis TaxID=6523 RepID=A0AAV2HMW4_LYMST
MELSYNQNNSKDSTGVRTPNSSRSARKLVSQSGSLEIIQGNGPDLFATNGTSSSCISSQPPSRPWSRASIGSTPPRPDSAFSKGSITPTKQISLQAVRRKNESSGAFIDNADLQGLKVETQRMNSFDKTSNTAKREKDKKQGHARDKKDQEPPQHAAKLRLQIKNHDDKKNATDKLYQDEEYTFDFISSIDVKDIPTAKLQDKDSEKNNEDSENSDSEDEDPVEVDRRAPNELLMEFVDCLMRKDYKNAEKLCQMILLYEPKNPEALKFQPLIQRKLKLDERAALDDQEEDEDDSDSDDTSTSSDETLDDEEDVEGEENGKVDDEPENPQVCINPARAILNIVFGKNPPEFIPPGTNINLAEEIKKLEEF